MPLERDLRDYLFQHPEVLFANEVVVSKRKEVYIEGRYIDLLFEVDGIHYIVELKRDTIRRETIGQIFEYYGLMRRSHATAKFRMILVAPSIPDFRRIPLEEFGIRCVEVPHPTAHWQTNEESVRQSVAALKRPRTAIASQELTATPSRIEFENLLPPVSRMSWSISQLLLRDGLVSVERDFFEFEIRPVKMLNSSSQDILCFPTHTAGGNPSFVRGGAWWAYAFGQIEEVPKNDVPNISVNTLPWGVDVAVNAELRSSQQVMLEKISASTGSFDELVVQHGNLRFQAWLKLEHQPRFYHWIPVVQQFEGSWRGADVLSMYRRSEMDFAAIRERWIGWIKDQRKELTGGQIQQMERSNQRLNLALRFVHTFEKEDPIWYLPYEKQTACFGDAYRKLKPLIQFFQ